MDSCLPLIRAATPLFLFYLACKTASCAPIVIAEATIAEAANYDIDRIKKAYCILKQNSNVENVVGFMIKAIEDNKFNFNRNTFTFYGLNGTIEPLNCSYGAIGYKIYFEELKSHLFLDFDLNRVMYTEY